MSQVKIAASEYAKGNYSAALDIYLSLGKTLGEEFFRVNVFLCEQRLKKADQLPVENREMMHPEMHVLRGSMKKDIACLQVRGPGARLDISAAVAYAINDDRESRKSVLLFRFLDKFGNAINDIPGVGMSASFKQHFKYLNANSKSVEDDLKEVFKISLPVNVSRVEVSLASFGISANESIAVRIQGKCTSEVIEEENRLNKITAQVLPHPIAHDKKIKRYTSDLVVACILDEFTSECLSHEVNLIKLTQESWKDELENINPDFLLVESCWRGNDGNWGTLSKGSGGGKKLSGLLGYCKQLGIPTVFWNKEDPPHYDKFGAIAALFDLALTTDVNMVSRYKSDFGIDVYPLSFGAQPKIHNPVKVIDRQEKAVFAGSYYGDKPKRCDDFNEVMSQLQAAGIQYDIYDRNYQKSIEKFSFPEKYQKCIIGNLPPEEVWKAHKGYKYQVNMNSVQDSATMFARRVYESLASGTPVISNESVGVRELFGDIAIMPGEYSISEQLRNLEASPNRYNELARRGVRKVMREHTYGHRIQSLCRLLGIDVDLKQPSATMAFTVRSEAEVVRAKEIFELQTLPNKHLFIELENFDNSYKFLNYSNDTVTYAMSFAHQFYSDDASFYSSQNILKCNINQLLSSEVLEDSVYWGDFTS